MFKYIVKWLYIVKINKENIMKFNMINEIIYINCFNNQITKIDLNFFLRKDLMT